MFEARLQEHLKKNFFAHLNPNPKAISNYYLIVYLHIFSFEHS